MNASAQPSSPSPAQHSAQAGLPVHSQAAVLASGVHAQAALDEAVRQLEAADGRRAGVNRVSGYVQAGGEHFHVAKTSEGPLVSLVQWQRTPEQGLKPIHDMFRVTPEQKAQAIKVWDAKIEAEEQMAAAGPAVKMNHVNHDVHAAAHVDAASSAKIKSGGAGRMR